MDYLIFIAIFRSTWISSMMIPILSQAIYFSGSVRSRNFLLSMVKKFHPIETSESDPSHLDFLIILLFLNLCLF